MARPASGPETQPLSLPLLDIAARHPLSTATRTPPSFAAQRPAGLWRSWSVDARTCTCRRGPPSPCARGPGWPVGAETTGCQGRVRTLPLRGGQKFPEHRLNLREGLQGPETRARSGHGSSALTSASEHPSLVLRMEATGFRANKEEATHGERPLPQTPLPLRTFKG